MNNLPSIPTPEAYIPIEALEEDILNGPKECKETFISTPSTSESYLEKIVATEKKLQILKKKRIVFSPPIITRLDAPVIFRYTINVIQGQSGVHKSRLASHFASQILQKQGCTINLLDLEYDDTSQDLMVYVDTERNHCEQFPCFVQEVLENAGYSIEEDPEMFRYTSLLDVPRKDRFPAVNEYLTFLRQSTNKHMVIFLDVLTDCVEDFNRADKSLELIDFLNRMINEHNCTFFCVIHENPGQGKARGHLGTELINKASTVIQIAFEKGPDGEDSDLLKIKFLKCRNSRRLPSFHVYYSQEENRLMMADERDVKDVENSRQVSAIEPDVIAALEDLFQNVSSTSSTELVGILTKRFTTSEKTIRRRLSDILTNQTILNIRDKSWAFAKKKDGREIIYLITPMETGDE